MIIELGLCLEGHDVPEVVVVLLEPWGLGDCFPSLFLSVNGLLSIQGQKAIPSM